MDFISKSDFTTVGGRNNANMEEEKKEEGLVFNNVNGAAKPAEKKEEEFMFDFEHSKPATNDGLNN